MYKFFSGSFGRNFLLRVLMMAVGLTSISVQVRTQVLPEYLDLTSQLIKSIELDYLLYTQQ